MSEGEEEREKRGGEEKSRVWERYREREREGKEERERGRENQTRQRRYSKQ